MSYRYSSARGSTAASKRAKMIRKQREQLTDREITKKKKENTIKINGPKLQIIDAYNKNNNIEDAYNVAKDINKKIGSIVYTKDMVDKWVKGNNKQLDKDDEER